MTRTRKVAMGMTLITILAVMMIWNPNKPEIFRRTSLTNDNLKKYTYFVDGTFVLNDNYRGEYDDYSPDELYGMIHKMSHLVVLADEKWGKMDLTENHVNAAILMTLAADIPGEIKDELMENLVLWKRSDFSQSDKLHNLVWFIQDGTVGYATGVDSRNQTGWDFNEDEYTE